MELSGYSTSNHTYTPIKMHINCIHTRAQAQLRSLQLVLDVYELERGNTFIA